MKTKQKDKTFRTSEVKRKQSKVEYKHSFRNLEVLNALLKLSINKSSIPKLLGQAQTTDYRLLIKGIEKGGHDHEECTDNDCRR